MHVMRGRVRGLEQAFRWEGQALAAEVAPERWYGSGDTSQRSPLMCPATVQPFKGTSSLLVVEKDQALSYSVSCHSQGVFFSTFAGIGQNQNIHG